MGIIPCDGHQLRHIHCRPVITSSRFSSYCIEKATHDYSEYTLCTALCLVLTGRRVVNLVATLAALLRPGEVSHGDDEEAVGAVRNTSQCVIPGGKGGHETEGTTSNNAVALRTGGIGIQVANPQHEESHVEGKEEEEEGHGRSERAEKQDEGEDEPAHEEKTELVVKLALLDKRCFNGESTGSENDSEGDPETTVG